MSDAPTASLEWLMGLTTAGDGSPVCRRVSRRWALEVSELPFEGMCGLVMPVTTAGRTDAVLKMQFPHD